MQPVGLILLAAGASARLGQPKQLLPYRGRTLLRHAAEVAAASGCQPLVLVTGALHAELVREVAGLPFEVVHNEAWAAGMGSSIRAGLAALEAGPTGPTLAGAVVMLCDQPLLTPAVLKDLEWQFVRTGQPVVACAYGGTRGVPALFGREVFPSLRALARAGGAQALLQQYAHWPAVAFVGGEIDVDTATQYQQLKQK